MEQQTVEKVPPKPGFVDGTWIKMGGQKEYLVPPLNFRALKGMREKLKTMDKLDPAKGLPSDEEMDVILEVVHAAMQRNYPDLKLEDLDELVDMGNFVSVFEAIVAMSGLVPAATKGGARATA